MKELQKEGYTRAIDWWSIGIVLYEMLLGRLPFSAPTRPDLFASILTHDPLASVLIHPANNLSSIEALPSPLPPGVMISEPAHTLLSHLLRKDPRERLSSFVSAKSHAFFAQIDWDRLGRRELEPPFKPNLDTMAAASSHDPVYYFESEFTRQPIELTPPLSRSSTAFLNVNSAGLFDSFSYYGSSTGASTSASSASSRSSLTSFGQSHLPSDRYYSNFDFKQNFFRFTI